MKFIVITFIFALIYINGFGQFNSATIGIDGLTCSMCSNGVERSLRQLDFVQNVKMDLNANLAEISFVPGKKVVIKDLSKKVKDGGYSVRFLNATFNFSNSIQNNLPSFNFEGNEYFLINELNTLPEGAKTITFLGKDYLSRSEYNKRRSVLTEFEKKNKGKKNIYYITL